LITHFALEQVLDVDDAKVNKKTKL